MGTNLWREFAEIFPQKQRSFGWDVTSLGPGLHKQNPADALVDEAGAGAPLGRQPPPLGPRHLRGLQIKSRAHVILSYYGNNAIMLYLKRR